jgi:hypothetical protein
VLRRADPSKTLTSIKSNTNARILPYPKIIPKAPAEPERTPRGFTLEEVLRDDASTTRG